MENQIFESIAPVIRKSKHVRINKENIKTACSQFNLGEAKYWMAESPYDLSGLSDSQKLNFIFVFGSINFCYWGSPKWTVEYRGAQYDGAWGMIACMGKAIEAGIPLLSAGYLSSLGESDFARIVAGAVPIPLFSERLCILKEQGRILEEKYQGQFLNVVKQADNDALRLLNIIVDEFPSFDDSATYHNQKVLFYKRAHLAVSDVFRTFAGTGFGNLKNISQLTAFADYKIPQTLRKLGILEYAPELAEKIDRKIQILLNSEEEIEIRAQMIWAIELMKKELQKKNPCITSMDVDSYVWLLGQDKSPDDKPYHLTRTVFY